MKKIISLLIAAILLVSCLAPAAFAAGAAQVTVGEVTAAPGETVSVSADLSNNPGFATYTMTISYDDSALKLTSIKSGSFNGAFVGNPDAGIATFANATPVTGDGTLFTMKFEVLAQSSGTYPVSVSVGDMGVSSTEQVSCSGGSGAVIVTVPHVCEPEFVEEVPASCTETGVKAHYACECGKLYSDAEGKNEVTADSLVIAKKAHSYVDGKCEHCGASQSTTTVIIPTPGDDDEKKPTFEDVLPGSYYYDAVEWAVANGITNGITATTFCPDMICTRAQMVTFLWRAAGKPAPETTEMPFTDVADGAYYYDAVLWAVENGITNGTSETTFSPNADVTRAQTVTFLWRMQKSPDADGEMVFTDVKQDAYYAEAVLWAVENGITNGTSETTFSPNNGCTRAQIVTFLYRYFN